MPGPDRFLMCPPRFYRVAYVINPWREGNIGRADAVRALEQWAELRRVLSAHGTVELTEPAGGLPAMPFTVNAGLVYGQTFIPARLRFPQRQPETPRFTEWFRCLLLPCPWRRCGRGRAGSTSSTAMLSNSGEPWLRGARTSPSRAATLKR